MSLSRVTLRLVGLSLCPVPEDLSACPLEPLESQRRRLFVSLMTIDPSIQLFPNVFRPFSLGPNAFPR